MVDEPRVSTVERQSNLQPPAVSTIDALGQVS
jgi:hypothetical protein